MRIRPDRLALGTLFALGLGGCSMAPTYRTPVAPLPASYGDTGIWKVATPTDEQTRGDWWQVFGSSELNDLEQQLAKNSPDLAAALAHYDGARAYLGEVTSQESPTVDLAGSPVRTRQSDNRPLRGTTQPDNYSTKTVGFNASYELDLWGRVRNDVSAGKADVAAASADFANARLSLQAELADLYVRRCGVDIEAKILDDSIGAYRQALTLTTNRFNGGVASQLDVSRARAQLADALAQSSDVAAQRDVLVHAIDRMTGAVEVKQAAPSAETLQVPATPVDVPSTLLERRPDIAAAERRTYAANQRIGVARSAFFPQISIGAGYGWQDAGGASLLTAANRMWALGPTAVLSVLDGGLRHAKEREAKAHFDEAAADYRATVLTAFQQVRDDLGLLHHLGDEADQEQDAANAAHDAQNIATHRYAEGTVNFLDVVDAQSATLDAERKAEQVRTRRLEASVQLIRALGGGWQANPPASTPARGSPSAARPENR